MFLNILQSINRFNKIAVEQKQLNYDLTKVEGKIAIDYFEKNIDENCKTVNEGIEYLIKLTELELVEKEDLLELNKIIALHQQILNQSKKLFESYNAVLSKNHLLFKKNEEFNSLISAFEEHLNDVEMIFFELRPSKTFQKLIEQAEEIL